LFPGCPNTSSQQIHTSQLTHEFFRKSITSPNTEGFPTTYLQTPYKHEQKAIKVIANYPPEPFPQVHMQPGNQPVVRKHFTFQKLDRRKDSIQRWRLISCDGSRLQHRQSYFAHLKKALSRFLCRRNLVGDVKRRDCGAIR